MIEGYGLPEANQRTTLAGVFDMLDDQAAPIWDEVCAEARREFERTDTVTDLDVGQGTSQVVNLGDDSAIVIDCGPSYYVLGDLLERRLGIQRIAALVLSHNHQDHSGGLSGLVGRYRKSIDRIYFLQDKTPKQMQSTRSFAFLR